MRNLTRTAALAAVCLFATPAFAQKQTTAPPPKVPSISSAQQGKITPQMTIPATRDGAKLTLPPGMVAAKPSFTAPQLDSAKAAKVALAGKWGLSITQAALQPSYWLTPQQPFLSPGGNIYIANDVPTTPNYTATASMPYGSISMTRTPSGAWWIGLWDVPATPKDWFLVECHVGGASTYHASVDFGPTPSVRESHVVIRTGLVAVDGKIGFVVEPSTQPKRKIAVGGRGPAGGNWTFGGCEITPVRP